MPNPLSDRFNRALDRIGVGLIGFSLAFALGQVACVSVFSAACHLQGHRAGLRVEYRTDGGCLALIDGYGWAPFAVVAALRPVADAR